MAEDDKDNLNAPGGDKGNGESPPAGSESGDGGGKAPVTATAEERLNALADRLESKLQGVDTLVGKWSNEIGNLRKSVVESPKEERDPTEAEIAALEEKDWSAATKLRAKVEAKREAEKAVSGVKADIAALSAQLREEKLNKAIPGFSERKAKRDALYEAYKRGDITVEELMDRAVVASETAPPDTLKRPAGAGASSAARREPTPPKTEDPTEVPDFHAQFR